MGKLLVLICVLLLATASARGQPSERSKGSAGPRQAADDTQSDIARSQQGTEEHPLIVRMAPASQDDTRSAEDARDRKEKQALDRKLVDFNGDLAFYTGVLAWLAGFQFFALIAQVVFLYLAFRESRRAGDIAREAMIAGDRAFVFATGLGQFWEHVAESNTYNWRFRPNWQNSGDTPTKNMTMHVECVLRDEPLPTGFNFNYETREIGKALIPPRVTIFGGIAPRVPAPAITPEDILEVEAGRKYLYLWGWAKYSDVFPESREHLTRFCWIILPAGDPRRFKPRSTERDEMMEFGYIYALEGNCADDECG